MRFQTAGIGLVLLLVLGVFGSWPQASTPQVIRVEGYLKQSGTPVTGPMEMTFALFDAQFGGLQLTVVGPLTVDVNQGFYEVDLPFTADNFNGAERWLEVTVSGQVLSPRMHLGSVPFAYNADTLDGLEATAFAKPVDIAAHAADPTAHQTEIAGAISSHLGASDPHSVYLRKAGGTVSGTLTLNPSSGPSLVTTSGNVGIGTTSPASQLHVSSQVTDIRATSTGPFGSVGSLQVEHMGDDGWSIGTGANDFGGLGGLGFRTFSGKTRMVILNNGNVGFGVTAPATQLHLSYPVADLRVSSTGSFGSAASLQIEHQGDDGWQIGTGANDFGGAGGLGFRTFSGNTRMVIRNSGSVGIGTTNPATQVHVSFPVTDVRATSTGPFGSTAAFQLEHLGDDGWQIGTGANDFGGLAGLGFRTLNSGLTAMVIKNNGDVGIGTTSPSARLEVAGLVKTNVLQITGGANLAEPFELAESENLLPGSVVVIDEANSAKLKLSDQPYDRRVAGVLSGAGGLGPGVTMSQHAQPPGSKNVALSGRVYVLATTANGPIGPGDSLTTSSIAGHAMKAASRHKAQGAIIGKAMSALKEGQGLVLVLVNLQ